MKKVFGVLLMIIVCFMPIAVKITHHFVSIALKDSTPEMGFAFFMSGLLLDVFCAYVSLTILKPEALK